MCIINSTNSFIVIVICKYNFKYSMFKMFIKLNCIMDDCIVLSSCIKRVSRVCIVHRDFVSKKSFQQGSGS